MNRAVIDVAGEALVVSQFTLAADLSRGNRPGFSRAAGPSHAIPLYEHTCARWPDLGCRCRPARSAPTWRWPWSTTDP